MRGDFKMTKYNIRLQFIHGVYLDFAWEAESVKDISLSDKIGWTNFIANNLKLSVNPDHLMFMKIEEDKVKPL